MADPNPPPVDALPATGNAVPGGRSPVTGLDPEFSGRIQKMLADMPPEIREKFSITSGYRSAERQAQVNPGVKNSLHTHGWAADTVRDPDVLAWVGEHGPKYGVGYTLKGMPGEDNHLEMLGARDKMMVGGALSRTIASAGRQFNITPEVSRRTDLSMPEPPPVELPPPKPKPPEVSTVPTVGDVDAAQRRAAAYRALGSEAGSPLSSAFTDIASLGQPAQVAPVQQQQPLTPQPLPGARIPLSRRLS